MTLRKRGRLLALASINCHYHGAAGFAATAGLGGALLSAGSIVTPWHRTLLLQGPPQNQQWPCCRSRVALALHSSSPGSGATTSTNTAGNDEVVATSRGSIEAAEAAGGRPSATLFSHNQMQAKTFDSKADFFASPESTPPEVQPRLQEIAAEAVRAVSTSAGNSWALSGSLIDVGTGTGCLLPHYESQGLPQHRVIGVDLSPKMMDTFRSRYPAAATFVGDFMEFQLPEGELADCIVFNSCFGNMWDPEATLLHAAELLRVGGSVIISHPLGSTCPRQLGKSDPIMVPNQLPDSARLAELIRHSPLRAVGVRDEKSFYLAKLLRGPVASLRKVLYLRGAVSHGWGRGSKKLGVATANLPADLFAGHLTDVPTGVYTGWGMVEDSGSVEVEKVVVNVGFSPTFQGEENPMKIVEAHFIGREGGDFYGLPMRLVLVGYQRPERRFSSFDELVSTIKQDVRDAAEALEGEAFAPFREDGFFALPAATAANDSITAQPFDEARRLATAAAAAKTKRAQKI
jgi:riboflavin kinase